MTDRPEQPQADQTTQIEIDHELLLHYQGQTDRQPVILRYDPEENSALLTTNPEIGNAVPMSVWHGLVRSYCVPVVPTSSAAEQLVQDLLPLLARVRAGYSCRWDGSNHIGSLDDDATRAEEEIEASISAWTLDLSPAETVCEWDAGDWYGGLGLAGAAAELGITAEMTDEDVERIYQARDDTETGPDGETIVLTGMLGFMLRLRDKLDA